MQRLPVTLLAVLRAIDCLTVTAAHPLTLNKHLKTACTLHCMIERDCTSNIHTAHVQQVCIRHEVKLSLDKSSSLPQSTTRGLHKYMVQLSALAHLQQQHYYSLGARSRSRGRTAIHNLECKDSRSRSRTGRWRSTALYRCRKCQQLLGSAPIRKIRAAPAWLAHRNHFDECHRADSRILRP